MEHIQPLFSFSVFLFLLVQSGNLLVDASSASMNLSKYYEDSVNDLISERLSGTKYCESILLPTESTLKKSLEATLYNPRRGVYLDERDHVDACCRSLHKCDAFKHTELNYTSEWNIQHCECEHSFRTCLNDLNTKSSIELASIHALKATKCYAKDYPIVKCIKFEANSESKAPFLEFMSSAERGQFFNRCMKYELDDSQPQKLQLFDLPFNNHGIYTITVRDEKLNEVMRILDGIEPKELKTEQELFNAIAKIVKAVISLGCDNIQNSLSGMKKVSITDIADPLRIDRENMKLKMIIKAMRLTALTACKNENLLEKDLTTQSPIEKHITHIIRHNHGTLNIESDMSTKPCDQKHITHIIEHNHGTLNIEKDRTAKSYNQNHEVKMNYGKVIFNFT